MQPLPDEAKISSPCQLQQNVILLFFLRLYGNAPTKDLVHSSGSMVAKKAFQFLSSRGELKLGSAFEGREMSQFLVKRLQASLGKGNFGLRISCWHLKLAAAELVKHCSFR